MISARRGAHRLRADPSRVITNLFVPGQEGFDREDSRTALVLARLFALDDEEIESALQDVVARFDGRHRDLLGTFRRHAAEVGDRLETGRELSESRRLLLGATFTSEYAIEGAALCNPSMVAHPDQSGVPIGSLRFVMSVRAIGEGHRSSIGFRTGTIDGEGLATLDPPPAFATTGTPTTPSLEAATLRSERHRLDRGGGSADDRFDASGERTYGVEFPVSSPLSERVLWPAMGTEAHGMEDARFVRFRHDDGRITNYATYTAYDGDNIRQQLLETEDFRTFTSSPIAGDAAANKGLALFPRRIDGRFAALSRWDRETTSVAFSTSLHEWPDATPCEVPSRSWELLQLGNCGSPIETRAGWLVLTHGVGPMRTYSIGAVLLDLHDPSVVLHKLERPLLAPDAEEQDGYVPNVVYSCGSLVHAGTLVLPYGIGDASIGIASVPVQELLDALERSPAA